MFKKLEFWGVLGTFVYLAVITAAVALKFDSFLELKLNELGDFLAGVFGPIAFLWLVLGFLQQGRELKISSDALRMQVEELKQSGEQQAHLVAVGREQITAQIAANNYERLRYEKSMNAHFIFYPQGRISVGELHTHTFEIHNAGSDAFEIQLMSKLPGNNFFGTYTVLKKDERVSVPFTFAIVEEDFSTILHCFYKTFDGRQIGFEMDLAIGANDQKVAVTRKIKVEDL